MSSVYLVVNEYRTEDGEGIDILEIWSTQEKAVGYLESWVTNLQGSWNLNHTTFNADNSMPLDMYYIEEREVKD